jgi:hypothetical protein
MALPTFTDLDRREHAATAAAIAASAAEYLATTIADHRTFFARHGVSKYFGDRNKDYSSVVKRRAELRRLGKPEALAEQQVPIACIVLAKRALGQGFAEHGGESVWSQIDSHLRANGHLGSDLVTMLGRLGWRTCYWNPDPSKSETWDEEDRRLVPLKPGKTWMAEWGGNAIHDRVVREKGVYGKIPVSERTLLVGFGKQVPVAVRDSPFLVGIANGGYHVFPGSFGQVIEAHSMRSITDAATIESAPFNPLAAGGAPRWSPSVKYRSGVLALPPVPR